MNLRILKKQCKHAMEILIAECGYRRENFHPADGSETVNAPANMPARLKYHQWLHPGLLPGTMLLWERVSYEYDEWDAKLPTEMLRDIICIEHTNWEKLAREEMADA